MLKLKKYTLLLLVVTAFSCTPQKKTYTYESETLKIEQLTEHSFLHVSYLQTESFGKVACNGMIVIDYGEALIIDTPVNDADSKELIDWIKGTLQCTPKGVIATHFHDDCLGGLNEFHNRNIPSYASNATIALAEAGNKPLPQNGFDRTLELKVGTKTLISEFPGEGHTRDNIVSYFPGEKVLFGGCLVKSLGAGKGNLEDANVHDWSKTAKRVKEMYTDAVVVIPGHGKQGGLDLLDYTAQLFKE